MIYWLKSCRLQGGRREEKYCCNLITLSWVDDNHPEDMVRQCINISNLVSFSSIAALVIPQPRAVFFSDFACLESDIENQHCLGKNCKIALMHMFPKLCCETALVAKISQ